MSSEDAEREIVKLFEACPDSALDAADGSLKNTSRLCLDICRDFCRDSFYATRTNGTPSVLDVYRDKKLLERVLKNRLGWYTTTEPLKLEDGTIVKGEHPYLFDISHKMVVQGCHSSMVTTPPYCGAMKKANRSPNPLNVMILSIKAKRFLFEKCGLGR